MTLFSCFTCWNSGEPNGKSEHCLEAVDVSSKYSPINPDICTGGMAWNDIYRTKKRPAVICERLPTATTTTETTTATTTTTSKLNHHAILIIFNLHFITQLFRAQLQHQAAMLKIWLLNQVKMANFAAKTIVCYFMMNLGSCPAGWVDKTADGLNCYILHNKEGSTFNYQESLDVSSNQK